MTFRSGILFASNFTNSTNFNQFDQFNFFRSYFIYRLKLKAKPDKTKDPLLCILTSIWVLLTQTQVTMCALSMFFELKKCEKEEKAKKFMQNLSKKKLCLHHNAGQVFDSQKYIFCLTYLIWWKISPHFLHPLHIIHITTTTTDPCTDPCKAQLARQPQPQSDPT